MIFTIASHYVSKPVSCVFILFAIPRLSKRILITFLYALPLMIGAYVANFAFFYLIDTIPKLNNVIATMFAIIYIFFVTGVDVYIVAFWNLANVILALEPNVHGLSAMKRSKQLLRGKTIIATFLVLVYLLATFTILFIVGLVMVINIHIIIRILLVVFCVIIMAGVNFLGLIGQSILYYACKSYHNQVIDKEVLYAHLDGKESGNDNSSKADNMEV
ncbi:hypothetical protein MKW98_008500 [Papaver atlanticum]|uniref:Uncharacterized protein n=1 Tax=Papaver atlanticum TaxID=357466 RepID=A0AAD4TCX5_9MAGN|nr:hypothetical protein MKW98_008500 [Papaver atlanticum]